MQMHPEKLDRSTTPGQPQLQSVSSFRDESMKFLQLPLQLPFVWAVIQKVDPLVSMYNTSRYLDHLSSYQGCLGSAAVQLEGS